MTLVIEPHAKAIESACGDECIGDLEKLFGGEHSANGGTANNEADVMDARKGG